jgi:hypothetical protein
VSEHNSMDDVIDVYKKDVDMTLIRECLKLTVEERIRRLQEFEEFREELQRGLRQSRDAIR